MCTCALLVLIVGPCVAGAGLLLCSLLIFGFWTLMLTLWDTEFLPMYRTCFDCYCITKSQWRFFGQTPIGFCHYFINHSQEHFTEPEKFNPDRWLREGKNVHPFASVPFGFGARMCPGMCMKMQTVELLV